MATTVDAGGVDGDEPTITFSETTAGLMFAKGDIDIVCRMTSDVFVVGCKTIADKIGGMFSSSVNAYMTQFAQDEVAALAPELILSVVVPTLGTGLGVRLDGALVGGGGGGDGGGGGRGGAASGTPNVGALSAAAAFATGAAPQAPPAPADLPQALFDSPPQAATLVATNALLEQALPALAESRVVTQTFTTQDLPSGFPFKLSTDSAALWLIVPGLSKVKPARNISCEMSLLEGGAVTLSKDDGGIVINNARMRANFTLLDPRGGGGGDAPGWVLVLNATGNGAPLLSAAPGGEGILVSLDAKAASFKVAAAVESTSVGTVHANLFSDAVDLALAGALRYLKDKSFAVPLPSVVSDIVRVTAAQATPAEGLLSVAVGVDWLPVANVTCASQAETGACPLGTLCCKNGCCASTGVCCGEGCCPSGKKCDAAKGKCEEEEADDEEGLSFLRRRFTTISRRRRWWKGVVI